MAEKKIPITRKGTSKNQYHTILERCKAINEVEQPLVNNIIYNINNLGIPRWKALSKVQKVALFSEYIVNDTWLAVTLLFSDEFMEECLSHPKVTDFIRRRLNANFKNKLGYIPQYLFCVEFEDNRFHIHGAIQPEGSSLDAIKRALKTTAFGRHYTTNIIPGNHKVYCRPIYDGRGWGRYILKRCNHPGFDIYMRTSVIRAIRKRYNAFLNKKYLIKLNSQTLI